MRKIGLATSSALALLIAGAAVTRADDISAKKLAIKDNDNPAKRQFQVQSNDGGVTLLGADDPGTNGAAIHAYSATDDFCAILPGGPAWQLKNSGWKYKNKATKASAQVGDGKLSVKLKSGVTYTLADDGTQGPINVQVQFGTGTRYCMRCTTPKKNTDTKYQAKACAVASCDPEPSGCDPTATTTTTTTSTTGTTSTGTTSTATTSTVTTTTGTTGTTASTTTTTGTTAASTTATTTTGPTTTVTTTTATTTTTTTVPGVELQGALTATPGRFNYNLTLGLPGANAACNTNFPGTHACTYAELQIAAAAGDLDGLTDIGSNTVTSFWAIDGSQPPLQQCQDDVSTFQNWEYGTAHTPSRGQKVSLNNGTGVLGPLQSSLQCNFSGNSWVGCCL